MPNRIAQLEQEVAHLRMMLAEANGPPPELATALAEFDVALDSGDSGDLGVARDALMRARKIDRIAPSRCLGGVAVAR